MKREIKFRIWSDSDKEMTNHDKIRLLPEDAKFHHIFDDKTVIWMQFTGLTDKNGAEIYEKDFIELEDGYSVYISFQKGAFGYDGSFGFIPLLENNMNVCEVIGNICENPGLL